MSNLMVEVIIIFGVLAALIGFGFLAESAFRRTGIPDVLFLIIVGALLSSVLKWVAPENFGIGAQLFATFALIFILFQGAININFRSLFDSLFDSFKLTILSFISSVIVVSVIGTYFLNLPALQSILLGAILGGTSSAVVIPIVQNMRMKKKFALASMLESALSDVFSIIAVVTIIAIIATGNIEVTSVSRDVLSSFSLALIIGALTGIVWIFLLNKSKNLKASYMVTIAVVLGLYSFVESPFVSASGAIAALAFGLVLGNSKGIFEVFSKFSNNDKDDKDVIPSVLSPSARNFYSEISFFVKVFFFIYLGILMDFSNPTIYAYAFIISLSLFFIRPLSVKLSFRGSDEIKSRAILEVLIPKGLAAAVLAQLAVQQNIQHAEFISSVVFSVILISIVLTSLFTFTIERGWFFGFYRLTHSTSKAVRQEKEERVKDSVNEELFKRLELAG